MTTRSNLEDEVWSQEVAYWDYLKAGDLDSFRSLWHEDVIAWPNNQSSPMNKDGIYQLVVGILAAIQKETATIEIKPISVLVYNNEVGITYYEVHTRAMTTADAEIDTQERFTHTWLKTEDGWKIIGGMSAPLPRL
jgi:ketosteroid isomerase-like protein